MDIAINILEETKRICFFLFYSKSKDIYIQKFQHCVQSKKKIKQIQVLKDLANERDTLKLTQVKVAHLT